MHINKIFIILVLLFNGNLFAKDIQCGLSYELMEVIAKVEGSPKRPLGYPYIISFNNTVDYEQELKNHDFIRIDSRSLDCKNRKSCINILDTLIKKDIKNVDLGAFQFNYKSHKFDKKEYFTLENSYQRACTLLETLIDKHGYSWSTIARYHSSTPSHNLKYRKMISRVLLASNK